MSASIPVTFRRVIADDFPAICGLVTNEEDLFLMYAQGRHPLTVDQVEALVAKRMEPTVMLLDGEVAGFGNFYGYRRGRSVFIGNLGVHPALRGRGLGRQLLGHMINVGFRCYGLRSVKLHVYNRNLAGLLLYTDMGFKPYAMKVKQDYKGDAVVMLSLRLKRAASGRFKSRNEEYDVSSSTQ